MLKIEIKTGGAAFMNEDEEFEDGDNEYITIVTESNFVAIDD